MGHGFLDVDVDPLSHGQHGGRGMGVIRGAYVKDVDLVPKLADELAKIAELDGIRMLANGNVQAARVNVAGRHDVPVHRQGIEVSLALTADADARYLKALIGSEDFRGEEGEGEGGGGGSPQERPT